jgi:hypothetical protein
MDVKFGFYVHHRPDGTPFYVGKGDVRRSRLLHKNRNRHHLNIVNKDGPENITITFTACASEEEAFRKEIALIALYRQIGLQLVNLTDGGEGPSNMAPEVKAKIRAAQLGRKHSVAARKKMSATRKGRKMSPKLKAILILPPPNVSHS